jgi:hypothetical protein
MHLSWEDTAEKLTLQAVQAAEEGRWDTVDLCYQRRSELFRVNDVSRSLARRLHPLDSRIHDRLRMATMSIQHLLTEVASKRRLLERFDSEPQSDLSQDRSRRVSRLV